jgi:hypothetical protein
LFSALLLAACGKVGDPQPPFIRIPEAIKDLSVTQAGYNLVLSWTNPPRYVDGSAATNLARIRIRTAGGPETTVNVTMAGQSQSYSFPVEPAGARQRSFTVIVETNQGKTSEASNVASITPVDVPGRVQNLTATPDQRRIFLRWDKPQERGDLADAYTITRSDVPAEAATVMDTRYEDVRYQPGKMVVYQVTAARSVNGKLVMGVGSESRSATLVDTTPPAAPTGLEVTQSILTWEANSEADLAGYYVFRSESADGPFTKVANAVIPTNLFNDPSYQSGLYYEVSAVDEFNNESVRSAPYRAP